MRNVRKAVALVLVGAIALSMAACKKKTYTKITPDEFTRKLEAEGYQAKEPDEKIDHVIRSVAAVSLDGGIAVYDMFETVDVANEYWEDFKEESMKQNDAGTLTACKFSEHEAYIEDPKMCSYVIIVDEMLIIIIAMNKDDAKECKSVLGY